MFSLYFFVVSFFFFLSCRPWGRLAIEKAKSSRVRDRATGFTCIVETGKSPQRFTGMVSGRIFLPGRFIDSGTKLLITAKRLRNGPVLEHPDVPRLAGAGEPLPPRLELKSSPSLIPEEARH